MSEPEIARLARNLAEQNNVDWRRLSGTGPGGLILERDVLDYLARVMAGEEALDPTPEPLPDGMDEWPEVHADSVGNYSRSAAAQSAAADAADAGLGASPLQRAADEVDDLAQLDEDVFLFGDDEDATPVAPEAAAQDEGASDDGASDDAAQDEDPAAGAYAYRSEAQAPTTDGALGSNDDGRLAEDDDLLLVSDEPVSEPEPEEALGGGWSERSGAGSDALDEPLGSIDVDDYVGTSGATWQEDALSFDAEPSVRPKEDLSDLWDTSAAGEGDEPAVEPSFQAFDDDATVAVGVTGFDDDATTWATSAEPEGAGEVHEQSGFTAAGAAPLDAAVGEAGELSDGAGWEAAEVVADEFVTFGVAADEDHEGAAEDAYPSPSFEPAEPDSATWPVAVPAFAPHALEVGAALRYGGLPLARTPNLLRRNVDVSALAAAQLAAGLELGGDEPLSAAPFLLRAVAKAAQDAGLASGQVALAEVAGAVRLRRVDDAATRPFVDLVADLAGSGTEEDEVALAVVDLSGLDVDEAVLDLDVPAVTLGRFMYDSDSGAYRSTLALTGALPIAQGARLLARVDELLASPVRLLV